MKPAVRNYRTHWGTDEWHFNRSGSRHEQKPKVSYTTAPVRLKLYYPSVVNAFRGDAGDKDGVKTKKKLVYSRTRTPRTYRILGTIITPPQQSMIHGRTHAITTTTPTCNRKATQTPFKAAVPQVEGGQQLQNHPNQLRLISSFILFTRHNNTAAPTNSTNKSVANPGLCDRKGLREDPPTDSQVAFLFPFNFLSTHPPSTYTCARCRIAQQTPT